VSSAERRKSSLIEPVPGLHRSDGYAENGGDWLMKNLLQNIRELILAACKAVVHSVDLIQVLTNFEIGRCIVEHEQGGAKRAQYGKGLLKELSIVLTAEFGRGFSRSNLEYMRKFYLAYQDRAPQISRSPSAGFPIDEKSRTLSGKFPADPKFRMPSGKFSSPFMLSWSQYVFLIAIANPDERRFYEIEASSCAKRSMMLWWRLPCPKKPTSMHENTSSTCRTRNCFGENL